MGRSLFGIFIVCALFSRVEPAHAQDCGETAQNAFSEIKQAISDSIGPLKTTFLNLNRFELDPLSADLVSLENEVDPGKKKKTLTYKVRKDRAKQHITEDLTPYFNVPIQMSWDNGANGSTAGVHLTSQAQQIEAALAPAVGVDPPSTSAGFIDLKKLQGMSLTQLKATLANQNAEALKAIDLYSNGDYTSLGLSKAALTLDPTMPAAYLRLISQADRAGVESALSDLKGKLTTDQKVELTREIGLKSGERYDFNRAGIYGNNANPTGAHSISTQYGKAIPYDAIITNLRSDNRLGICRDIAVAQSQILKQLGFKNVYGIAYNAGSNHAAVLAQNPDHPDQLLQFNYDGLEKADLKQGMKSLTRGEDYSTSYQFFNASGKSIANLPSELGSLITEGAGGNIRTLDPFLTRPQGSLASLSLETESGSSPRKTVLPVFVGRTSAGDDIVGIGMTTVRGDPDRAGVSFAGTAALAYQRKNVKDFSDHTQTFDALHLTMVMNLQAATAWKSIGSDGKAQVRATATEILTGDGARSGLTAKTPLLQSIGASFSGNTEVGMEGKTATADGKTSVLVRAATQYGLGTNNISSMSVNHFYHNVSYLRMTGETVVIPEKLKATLDAAVGFREFGPQALVQVGVEDFKGKWKGDAGYQGAISKDALTIAPGSERAVFMDLEHSIGKTIALTATYVQPTAVSFSQSQFQVGVKGSLSEILKRRKRRLDDSSPSQ